MTSTTRDVIRLRYAKDPEGYDRHRNSTARGLLLSDHDRAIFRSLLPRAAQSVKALEIGAGTGRFTVDALQLGFHVTATDLNQSMLERLREHVNKAELDQYCATELQDVFNITYPDNYFDLVYSIHVVPRFLTLEDQAAAVASLSRVVRPGGTLLFNFRNRASPYNLAYSGPAATMEQIHSWLAAGEMRVTTTRGKWLLSRRLLDLLPMPLCRTAAAVDRALLRFWNARAWDVFVVAVKNGCAH